MRSSGTVGDNSGTRHLTEYHVSIQMNILANKIIINYISYILHKNVSINVIPCILLVLCIHNCGIAICFKVEKHVFHIMWFTDKFLNLTSA